MTIMHCCVPAGPREIFMRGCADGLIDKPIAVPGSQRAGTLVGYEVRKNGRELYLVIEVEGDSP